VGRSTPGLKKSVTPGDWVRTSIKKKGSLFEVRWREGEDPDLKNTSLPSSKRGRFLEGKCRAGGKGGTSRVRGAKRGRKSFLLEVKLVLFRAAQTYKDITVYQSSHG